MLNRDCPKCEGTGRYRDSRIWGTMPGSATCDDCDGTGKLSRPAKPSVPPPVPPGVREAWGVGGAGPGRLIREARGGGGAACPADPLGPISRYEVQEVAEGAWRCWATDDLCRTIAEGNGGTPAAALAACQEPTAARLREALRQTVDLCNAMREYAPTLGLAAEKQLRESLRLLDA